MILRAERERERERGRGEERAALIARSPLARETPRSGGGFRIASREGAAERKQRGSLPLSKFRYRRIYRKQCVQLHFLLLRYFATTRRARSHTRVSRLTKIKHFYRSRGDSRKTEGEFLAGESRSPFFPFFRSVCRRSLRREEARKISIGRSRDGYIMHRPISQVISLQSEEGNQPCLNTQAASSAGPIKTHFADWVIKLQSTA